MFLARNRLGQKRRGHTVDLESDMPGLEGKGAHALEIAICRREVELVGGHRLGKADDLSFGVAQLSVEDLPGIRRGIGGQNGEGAKRESGQESEGHHR